MGKSKKKKSKKEKRQTGGSKELLEDKKESNKKSKEKEQISEAKLEERSTWNFDSFLKVAPFVLFSVLIPLYKYKIEFVWSKIMVGYLSIALSGPIIAYLFIKREKIIFNFPKTSILVLLFILLGSVSAFWAYNPYKVHQLAVMIAPGILAYLSVQLIMPEYKELKVIFLSIALTSTIVSGYGILQVAGVFPMPPDQYGNPDPISTFGLSNFTVEYLLLTFPLTLTLSLFERNPILKVILLISAIITFIYIVASENRAGWVGTIVALLTLGFILVLHITREVPFRRISKYVLGIVGGTAVFLTLFFSFTEPGEKILKRFKSFVWVGPYSSVSTRLLAWSAGMDMIKETPIFGVGAGNYEIFSWKYAPRLLDEMTMETNTRVDKAHNEYIQIFADLGIVGFSIFFAIILTIFKIYIDIFREGRRKKEIFIISTGIFLGIYATLAGASFNFSLQWPGSVSFFWFYVGLLEVLRARATGEEAIEVEVEGRKWLPALIGILITVASLGAPCINGIPICKQGDICLERKICRATPGLFAARNLMLGEIYYRMGQALKRFRRFDISERYYLKSLQHDNPAERTYYDLAYLYLAKNNGDLLKSQRTLALLERTLELVPYFGKGRRELGRMYIQLGQIDKGIEYVLRSTDSNPANIPEAFAVVANAYFRKGDYQKAIEYGKMALSEIENSPYKKKYGLDIPKRAFDENKVRAMALFSIGSSYVKLGKYDMAEKYLKDALALDPNNLVIKLNLSTVYINLGKFGEAKKILEGISPKNELEKSAKFFNLATLYAAQGDREKAKEYLEVATSINPALIRRAMVDKFLKDIL